jgi:hypothetical protein
MTPDVSTGLEAVAASQTLKTFLGPVAERVFGPLADDVGKELQQWYQGRRERFRKVVDRADRLLPPGAESDGRHIPMRVLNAVMNDGTLSDDEVAVNYFGGLLASSRTGIDRDDRGAMLSAVVGRLSTYEIRTHYLIYAHAHLHMRGSNFNLGMSTERTTHARILLPISVWAEGMEFTKEEMESAGVGDVLSDSVFGLIREELIDDAFGIGSDDALNDMGFGGLQIGQCLSVQLSPLGVRLFVWAHGRNHSVLHYFLDPEADFAAPGMPALLPGALTLEEARQRRLELAASAKQHAVESEGES